MQGILFFRGVVFDYSLLIFYSPSLINFFINDYVIFMIAVPRLNVNALAVYIDDALYIDSDSNETQAPSSEERPVLVYTDAT